MSRRENEVALGFLDGNDKKHEAGRVVLLRVLELVKFFDPLDQDGRREGAIGLPELDLGVDDVLHVGAARVGQDAPVAQRARSPFEAALGPADHLPLFEGGDHPG